MRALIGQSQQFDSVRKSVGRRHFREAAELHASFVFYRPKRRTRRRTSARTTARSDRFPGLRLEPVKTLGTLRTWGGPTLIDATVRTTDTFIDGRPAPSFLFIYKYMIGNLNHGRLLLLFDWLPIVAVRPGTFTLYLSVFLFCCLFYLFIFF